MLLAKILKKNILTGVLFFMVYNFAIGKPFFKMNEQCLKAQTYIYELRIDEATIILQNENLLTPENIAVPWLQEYCLFISLFISENEKAYQAKQQEWKKYIQSTENLKFDSPWYRFILSDMYIHRAAVKLKMDDKISAGNDIKKANSLLKENESRFPEFLPDNKNTGLINVLFSVVPQNYVWLTQLLGFEGNLNEGIKKIEKYLQYHLNDHENRWLKVETSFIYALLQYNFQKKMEASWQTIEPYTKDFGDNLLLNYMRATIAGYSGRNDEMIQILSKRPSNPEILPFYYMDYLLGVAKLRRLDADAEQYFKIYTVKFKGLNYIKSAYRYLAWCALIKGNHQTANTYYSLCIKNGKAYQEEDIQAENEAHEFLRWSADLLRARLLFDGHYYNLALNQLNTINENKLANIKFQLEFYYRKARIYYEIKDYPNALILFDKVITKGKNETYYYASYSALYMADIYEHFNNKERAIYYYKKAKDDFPENKEYRNSIEQKSKLGLKRLAK